MAIVLSGKDSKFNTALTAMLSSDLLERLQFDKAVISDDGTFWELFFTSSEQLSEDNYATVNSVLEKIIPSTVTFETNFEIVSVDEPFEEQVTEEDFYSSIPLPDVAPDNEEIPEIHEEIPAKIPRSNLAGISS